MGKYDEVDVVDVVEGVAVELQRIYDFGNLYASHY